ncbi:GIY-YIG nuclease family protein [Terriglobus sp. RCC_193]|uniref:GIY-YIG nuclease family protein n=1 Tax=Terriglobus sp. RCC_193 TaxID=3239218 RepID=UPI003524B43E
MPQGFVYILGSDSGTLYIGVTSDLSKRVLEHKRGEGSQFTTRYGCHRLLYYELFDDIRSAIDREKSLKGKTRQKKLDLIRTMNPEFKDLAATWGWPSVGPKQSMAETDRAVEDWAFGTSELRTRKREGLLSRKTRRDSSLRSE